MTSKEKNVMYLRHLLSLVFFVVVFTGCKDIDDGVEKVDTASKTAVNQNQQPNDKVESSCIVLPEKAAALSAQGGVVEFTKPFGPLGQAFEEFHFETILDCMTQVMGSIRDYSARAYPDRRPVVLSGNPAGSMHVPRWVEMAAPFDYFNIECDVVSLHEDKPLAHFLGIAALSESVDTTLLVMPNATSNRRWNQLEDPQAYAGATGLSYAIGCHMHVPWCLYDGSQFTRFYGSLDAHQPIFRMIHDHAGWFDGYVPALWHVLDVPYEEDGVQDLSALELQILDLFRAGVPTVLRLKGDKAPAIPERFSGRPHLRTAMDSAKKAAAPDCPFEMEDSYRSAFLPPIPRVQHEASDAPLVLHIIRDFKDKSAVPASGKFTISKLLLKGAKVSKVEIAAPEWQDAASASVSWETDESGEPVVSVENVSAWALVRVHTAEPVKLPGVERPDLRKAMAESEIPLMRMIRFSSIWQRPKWVDDAIASDTDPLDGYHVSRISWSYDHSLKTLEYAQSNGMAFHGSDCFLHSYIALDGVPPQEGIPTFTPDWSGWVRYPDGQPMHIRPDFMPPRYGASFASAQYRTAMIERGKNWIDKGAAGIQFDDISGMVNRVWQYGGDFGDAFFACFRNYLLQRRFDGIAEDTPLDQLREQVMSEMKYTPVYEKLKDGTISVSKPSPRYPGLVWIGPAKPFSRPNALFNAAIEFRITEGSVNDAELLLMDGEHSVYLCRIRLGDVLPSDIAQNEWMTLRISHDLEAQTTRLAVGDGGQWSKARPFDMPLSPQMVSLSPALMIDPRYCSVEVRKIALDTD
ncbi:hypothetical protein SMSP2_01492 [Limihaloglobus sulfuriphilus]|uniref:Uncharacterized protein n=1 Tax=Limihaloglobus sulfuriphilus TaxID=1851148 RepID=A0A1Q2MFQ7_9BACT|nr:hypothetical protein SMSP2_01492 [Limihaloglobus sulfuriphilus]